MNEIDNMILHLAISYDFIQAKRCFNENINCVNILLEVDETMFQ